MKKLIFIAALLLSVLGATAQTDSTAAANDTVTVTKAVDYAEEMPDYPGGFEKMNKFIAKNLKYPKDAITNNIEGRVIAEFIVERDGSLSNIKISKDIGYGCGEELVRVIKKMPQWKPGTQKGKAVRVKMKLPVTFTIPK
jgi:TonB family protein